MELEPEVNYRVRKKKTKKHIIQSSWQHWRTLEWGQWYNWGKYATIKDRDQAFETLSNRKDRPWMKYRIKPA